jgi:hypothetical protein
MSNIVSNKEKRLSKIEKVINLHAEQINTNAKNVLSHQAQIDAILARLSTSTPQTRSIGAIPDINERGIFDKIKKGLKQVKQVAGKAKDFVNNNPMAKMVVQQAADAARQYVPGGKQIVGLAQKAGVQVRDIMLQEGSISYEEACEHGDIIVEQVEDMLKNSNPVSKTRDLADDFPDYAAKEQVKRDLLQDRGFLNDLKNAALDAWDEAKYQVNHFAHKVGLREINPGDNPQVEAIMKYLGMSYNGDQPLAWCRPISETTFTDIVETIVNQVIEKKVKTLVQPIVLSHENESKMLNKMSQNIADFDQRLKRLEKNGYDAPMTGPLPPPQPVNRGLYPTLNNKPRYYN